MIVVHICECPQKLMKIKVGLNKNQVRFDINYPKTLWKYFNRHITRTFNDELQTSTCRIKQFFSLISRVSLEIIETRYDYKQENCVIPITQTIEHKWRIKRVMCLFNGVSPSCWAIKHWRETQLKVPKAILTFLSMRLKAFPRIRFLIRSFSVTCFTSYDIKKKKKR